MAKKTATTLPTKKRIRLNSLNMRLSPRRRLLNLAPESRLAFLGGTGLGAGLSYLFDPQRGSRRRAYLRNKAVHLVKGARHTADVTSRDVRNRTKGLVTEIGSRLGPEEIDDELLIERVRSRVGQLVSHPSAIEVQANDGEVTLGGPVLAPETTRLVTAVSAVRGASRVDNRLEVHEDSANVPGLQGQGRRPRRLRKENWSPTARLVGVVAGGGIAAYGLARRGALGTGAILGGAGLLSRGATNIPLRRLTGMGAKRRGIDLQTTINIDAPVEDVFGFWADYTNFPRWMSNVKEVKELDQNRSRWTVTGPGRAPIMFDAEVSAFVPNERFGWRTVEEAAIRHSGLVEFSENPDGSTRVHLRMTYNPVLGGLGHAFAMVLAANPKKKIDEDLVRLKTLIETGHRASDAAKAAE